MTDPVLDAHRLSAFYYLISGPSPISIRDQILRGVTLAERLREAQEISATRPLLVIGAGVGGASAALESASVGIPTVLVEGDPNPFVTQRHASSRWIDPTQYDWPLDHYHHAQLPWSMRHRAFLFGFLANDAVTLASLWTATLRNSAPVFGSLLDVRYGRRVNTPPTRINRSAGAFPELLAVTFDDGSTAEVGAVIAARGFGTENSRFEQPPQTLVYEGQPFWGPDNFATLTRGRHNVLISGSGDGALQDYIRVVTHRPSAAAIARICNIPPTVMHAIQSAEDRSLRGRSWASDDRQFRSTHEAPYFGELEGLHRDMVDRSLRNPFVKYGLQTLIPSNPVAVTMVFRDPYISCYYGLNRFLTLLLSTYIQREFGQITLFPQTGIDAITPAHTNGNPCVAPNALFGSPPPLRAVGTYSPDGILLTHSCFEQDHRVNFSSPTGPFSGTYNVIIIRHGLDPGHVVPLPRPRHIAPYHRPA
jgi:hypothetical protein